MAQWDQTILLSGCANITSIHISEKQQRVLNASLIEAYKHNQIHLPLQQYWQKATIWQTCSQSYQTPLLLYREKQQETTTFLLLCSFCIMDLYMMLFKFKCIAFIVLALHILSILYFDNFHLLFREKTAYEITSLRGHENNWQIFHFWPICCFNVSSSLYKSLQHPWP